VNQPLQPYTKGSDLYPHVELWRWANEKFYLAF
jgi:hypothetical protein